MKMDKRHLVAAGLALALTAAFADAVTMKNGTEYALGRVPAEAKAELPMGGTIRFLLGENVTTGYRWEAAFNANEVEVTVEHRGGEAKDGLCGAPGFAAVLAKLKGREPAPAFIELKYRRPWEKDAKPAREMRLVLYKVKGGEVDANYPKSRTLEFLRTECANRGIVLTDWHLHIRGGMTPEMALQRERDSGIRSTAMENHGREWEIYDDAKLVAFAKRSRAVNPKMPVGIQVNDRDWFEKIAPETRAQFDYILADTMIMGKLPSGRDNRLWMVKEIPDPDKWMADYFAHTMRILDEPISILANPTYLPEPLAGDYDRLWTEERMRAVITKAVKKGVALEVQAESPYPRPQFLKLAKAMGAKFSFGTNNFDPSPKDLSRWLEAIVWLDLRPTDIWMPRSK